MFLLVGVYSCYGLLLLYLIYRSPDVCSYSIIKMKPPYTGRVPLISLAVRTYWSVLCHKENIFWLLRYELISTIVSEMTPSPGDVAAQTRRPIHTFLWRGFDIRLWSFLVWFLRTLFCMLFLCRLLDSWREKSKFRLLNYVSIGGQLVLGSW